jgi:uncharacterized spore protein YtfJ
MGLDGGASKEHDMKINELVESAKDSLTVTRVYGEPYEKNGVTVIPAASVAGGGGGGGGHDNDGQEGEGGGFGLSAKPAGVYVVSGDGVRWRPAVDVNRLVGSLVLLVGILTYGRIRLARLRAKGA